MATTNLIQGDVFTQILQEKLQGKAKLLNYAVNLGSLNDGVQQGETIKVLKWKHCGDAVDLTKGQAIATEEMQSTAESITIEHKAKGIEIYDRDKATCIDGQSMVDRAINQLAEVLVRAKEKSLAEKMSKAKLQYPQKTSQPVISSGMINEAMQIGFGDEQNVEDMACILINSRVSTYLYDMPEFVDVNKTYNTEGNGIIKNGLIGYLRGIAVVMSDLATKVGADYYSYIIKKNAIGYKCKKEDIEITRNAKYKRDEVFADSLFATAITDDSGVIAIKHKFN